LRWLHGCNNHSRRRRAGTLAEGHLAALSPTRGSGFWAMTGCHGRLTAQSEAIHLAAAPGALATSRKWMRDGARRAFPGASRASAFTLTPTRKLKKEKTSVSHAGVRKRIHRRFLKPGESYSPRSSGSVARNSASLKRRYPRGYCGVTKKLNGSCYYSGVELEAAASVTPARTP
jgi:hypothetical protein